MLRVDDHQEELPQLLVFEINFLPQFVYIHFIMFIDYLLTKDSYFYQSYYSKTPFFFYGLLIFYMTMLNFHAKSAGSPGYSTDEIDPENSIDKNHLNTDKFYCKHCQLYVPIRASHCSKCNKCILRRDHHCYWINRCVGRDNHLYFFIFTFLEFICQTIPDCDMLYHFFKIWKFKFSLSIVPCYILAIASSFGTIISCKLFTTCLYSILRNETTWERLIRDRITYLKDFPVGYNPFDKGIVGNIVEFCTMKKKKMKWEIKEPDISKFDDEFRILKN